MYVLFDVQCEFCEVYLKHNISLDIMLDSITTLLQAVQLDCAMSADIPIPVVVWGSSHTTRRRGFPQSLEEKLSTIKSFCLKQVYGFGGAKMSYELKYEVLEEIKKIEHHTQLHILILSSNNLRRYEGIPVKEVVNMYRELVDYIKKSTEKKIIFVLAGIIPSPENGATQKRFTSFDLMLKNYCMQNQDVYFFDSCKVFSYNGKIEGSFFC